jgi:hypothetical protein
MMSKMPKGRLLLPQLSGATLQNVVILAALGWTQACPAASLAAFTTCIGPQGTGTVCQLDAGTYQISSTLFIGRSNITIEGSTATSPGATVLQRAPGFTNTLLRDPYPNGLTSITVRDFTFDGNRAQNAATYSTYSPDVQIFTTASLLITNCDFINSPNFSLALYGAGTSGVVVNNSYFANAVISGFFSGPTGDHSGQDYTACSGEQFPDMVIIAGSRFEGFGQNALYSSMTNAQIVNNYFTETYDFAIGPYIPAGGQIDLDPCTDHAAVVGNTFANGTPPPGAGNTQGIELHGTDIAVVNNMVSQELNAGISIGGAANIFIANWDKTSATFGNYGGIGIHQGDPGAFDSQRPVDFITIDNANVVNNTYTGILVNDAVIPVNHLAITNTCLQGNSPGLSLTDLGADVVLNNNQLSGCFPN